MTYQVSKYVQVCILPVVAATLALAQDVSKDHPLIKRYPGSGVFGGDNAIMVAQFDEFDMVTGPIKDGKATKTMHLEGKVFFAPYSNPEDRSVLEIYRNYEQNLKQAGFQTLFACSGAECGGDSGDTVKPQFYSVQDAGWSNRYLAAKLARPEGDVYVSLLVHAQGRVGGGSDLYVIEVKPMENKNLVDAASLANDISSTGHVAVYGIYFDTGKAELKPESEATLKEIAKLLETDGSLKLYVVGHTDNQGAFAMNMDLSKRRADSVVTALTAKYGVAAGRLQAFGNGPCAPVASNDNEDGRARNRRVELVKE
jgi:outer membrane protein OmpA-like peptidoglycan-associated protein